MGTPPRRGTDALRKANASGRGLEEVATVGRWSDETLHQEEPGGRVSGLVELPQDLTVFPDST
jgi:hypothetical protein